MNIVAPAGPAAIARLVASNNEVQRRPDQRLIWQSVFENQMLYPGEAVRTATNAEAEILFFDEGTVVRMDPDSVIEIEKTSGGLNLDFLKGNLFIQSNGRAGRPITVRSGDQKIALTKSELSVSKSTASGALELDVFKGDAKVINSGAKKTATVIRKLKLRRPYPNEAVYIAQDGSDPVRFEWEPIDSRYVVSLEAGPSRTTLAPVKDVSPVSGSLGRLLVPMKTGKTYVRLIARSPRRGLNELKSTLLGVEVRAKIPPLLLEPLPHADVHPSDEKGEIVFRWSNPGHLSDMVLEASRSAHLKDAFLVQKAGEQLSQTVRSPNEQGRIYWRVSGRLPGTRRMISSHIYWFNLQAKGSRPLSAPIPKGSDTPQTIPLQDMHKDGLVLAWNRIQGAVKYELKIEEVPPPGSSRAPRIMKKETQLTEMGIRNLEPGTYNWTVIAKDGSGQVSPLSEIRTFTIDGVFDLPWADGFTAVKSVYKTQKPLLKVAWSRGPARATQWRVRIGSERQPASDHEWKSVRKPEFESILDEPGTYTLEAEAMDSAGVVLARTPLRTQELVQAPPLPAPEFDASLPKEIRADESGTAKIRWNPVDEAREYVLEVKSSDGKPVQSMRLRATQTQTELTRLKTGDYKISLQTVDHLGRIGPEGDTRGLRVPEYSNVSAPTLKGINIK